MWKNEVMWINGADGLNDLQTRISAFLRMQEIEHGEKFDFLGTSVITTDSIKIVAGQNIYTKLYHALLSYRLKTE